jgi:hypothetical protein
MQNARYGYMEADVLPLNYSRPMTTIIYTGKNNSALSSLRAYP